MITIALVLQVVALILLAMASFGVSLLGTRVSTFPLGMFFWLLSLMLGALVLHPIH